MRAAVTSAGFDPSLSSPVPDISQSALKWQHSLFFKVWNRPSLWYGTESTKKWAAVRVSCIFATFFIFTLGYVFTESDKAHPNFSFGSIKFWKNLILIGDSINIQQNAFICPDTYDMKEITTCKRNSVKYLQLTDVVGQEFDPVSGQVKETQVCGQLTACRPVFQIRNEIYVSTYSWTK